MNKLIVKFAAWLTMAALVVFTVGPALASQTVNTGLNRVEGGGEGPIIKAKWEMLDEFQGAPGVGEDGDDNSSAGGAQFLPSGIWGNRNVEGDAGELKYTICAIVTDPDGVSDIDGVYTDIFYPSDVAGHKGTHPNADNVLGGQEPGDPNPTTPDLVTFPTPQTSPDRDYGNQFGCGLPVEDENQLTQLTKLDGIELFCNQIKNHNNNLPTFFPLPGTDPEDPEFFTYDEICGATAELEKETAYVYCADKTLEWEDPSGDYKVEILALDKSGQFSHTGQNNPNFNFFEYLPLTSFEKDFTNVDYGNVKLSTHKVISGDLTWDGTNNANNLKPSVRNTGNTRLYIGIEQDDMGLGTTNGNWNVRYDSRVGNQALDWRHFFPTHFKGGSPTGQDQLLEDILDLSEIEEMDFSILITKFPNTSSNWSGKLYLSADLAPHRQCNGT